MNTAAKIGVGVVLVIILVVIILIYAQKDKVGDDFDFEMQFFTTGKAEDAILIRKEDKYMMIDTGESTLSSTILDYFEKNNINKLEYLVITHFDKDHVGSAASIIKQVEIGEIFQSNVPKDSEFYDAYLEAIKEKNITPTTVSEEIERTFGSISFKINGPDIVYDKNESNNSSLVVSIQNKDNKFLMMGDCENQRLRDFISINKEEYDFLKVPHHGRESKQLANLLQNRNIKYAVITSSLEEPEDESTLETLNEYKIKTYLTRKGNIKIYSNGTKIIVKQ